MRAAVLLIVLAAGAAANPDTPANAGSCSDDYVTVETVRGTIIDIKPAPEPFPSTDILFSAPSPCSRIWMQVLKPDAAACRIGGTITAKGIVTEDSETDAWEIGSAKNETMISGDDFTCR